MLRHCIIGLVACLTASCTIDEPPLAGHEVEKDSACHKLLLAQCGCCGDGKPSCVAYVTFLIDQGEARTNVTEDVCQTKVDASTDPAFCDGFDTEAELNAACQQFPPKDEPDAQ